MTRLGDLLHFGQLFKACRNNYFAQIAMFKGNFCKGLKIFHFSCGINFGQLLYTFGDFLLVTLDKIVKMESFLLDLHVLLPSLLPSPLKQPKHTLALSKIISILIMEHFSTYKQEVRNDNVLYCESTLERNVVNILKTLQL